MSRCAIRARSQGRLPGQRERDARTPARFRRSKRARIGRPRRSPTFLVRNAEALRFSLPAYLCFALVVVVTRVHARSCADELDLFQLADRLDLVPRGAGARAGRGDPDRRPRPLRALDDRLHAASCSRAWSRARTPRSLRLAGRARRRRRGRLRQRRRHRAARRLADRHDARHERHSPRRGARLFQRHAGRIFLAAAAPVHDRPRLPRHAGRRVRRAVRRLRRAAARQDRLRPAHLRHRQRRARGGALRGAGERAR